MAGGRGALLTLQPLKTSLVCKFPYLKQLPTCLEWCATFFSLFVPSVYKGQVYFIFYVYFLPSSGHFFFFFIAFRERGREKRRERERSIDWWPPLRSWTTGSHAPGPGPQDRTCSPGMCPTGEQTCNLSVMGRRSNQPGHTGQGYRVSLRCHPGAPEFANQRFPLQIFYLNTSVKEIDRLSSKFLNFKNLS